MKNFCVIGLFVVAAIASIMVAFINDTAFTEWASMSLAGTALILAMAYFFPGESPSGGQVTKCRPSMQYFSGPTLEAEVEALQRARKRNAENNTWEQRRLKHEYELGIAQGREVTKEERKQIKAHLAIERAVQTGDKKDMLNALQSLGEFIHDPRIVIASDTPPKHVVDALKGFYQK